MCNFIIRPIKCYVTVDYKSDGDMIELEAGQEVTVQHVEATKVVVTATNTDKEEYTVTVPMATFVHIFSDKKPKKAE